MKIQHYSVFAAAPGGGKQFAIVEGVTDPAEMQRIAASSGQPLTGFILNAASGLAEVRFFSPTKEKGSSDSGALVVGEHLRRMAGDSNSLDEVTVQMGNEHLKVFKIYDDWWSSQEDSHYLGGISDDDKVLSALGLSRSEVLMPAARVGNSKVNLAVRVSDLDTLMSLSPDFIRLQIFQQEQKLNGIIAFFWEKEVIGKVPDIVINRDNVHFRWFLRPRDCRRIMLVAIRWQACRRL